MTGRPREISDSQIEQAIDTVAGGVTLKDACERLQIGYSAVRDRIRRDERLSALHARARQDYLDYKVQEMNRIVDEEEDVQRARLKCDNIKWEAARVVPKKYGDRQRLEHTGEDGGPVVTEIRIIGVDGDSDG